MIGLLVGLLLIPKQQGKDLTGIPEKALEIAHLVEQEYVDPTDSDTMGDAMFNAMLLSLDPHSRYLSLVELQKEQESMQGNFDGIGVVLRYFGDTAYVGEVMVDGPADESGLLPGDCIVTVDGDTVSGVNMSNETVVQRIRGPHGSKVTLGIRRHNRHELLHYTIVRGRVSTPSLAYSGMLSSTTGYVHLTRFSETTAAEFHHALSTLLKEGMRQLVLDLRGNGGGLLDAAVGVADELLPRGTMIVYTEGSHQRRQIIRARSRGLFETGNLIVLVDEYSASASEIVAGCVQDNDRGLIFGRRTFGKGLVQRQFDLHDGSAVWLTVARYYTPSGRCIQRPYSHGSDEYYTRFLERLMEAPTTADTSYLTQPIDDSTQYFTAGGRIVYGGGGICPDRVIPYDASHESIEFNRLVNSGRASRVAFEYVISNIESIHQQYRDEQDFSLHFRMDNLDNLLPDASRLSHEQHARLVSLMKAYVAQSVYGQYAFYRIYNTIDNDLLYIARHQYQ